MPEPKFEPGEEAYAIINNGADVVKVKVKTATILVTATGHRVTYEVIVGPGSYTTTMDNLISRSDAIVAFDKMRSAEFLRLFN